MATPAAPAEADSFTAVYRILHRLAGRQLRGAEGTLDTTGLVHEAWMKLSDESRVFESRGHYLAVASTAMRQILVDHARRRRAQKRDAGVRVPASALDVVGATPRVEEVLLVDAALTRLAELDERLARVVEWRFFGGLDEAEIAAALDVDVRTVRRDWRKARAFILSELGMAAG